MIPGMDPRAMKAAMRKLGMQQEDLDATEVVIRLRDGHELVLPNPSVAKVTMMGQETFQVSGQYEERLTRHEHSVQLISEDDIKTVVGQTGVSDAEAKDALAKVEGDIAAAIMFLNAKKG